MTIERVRSIEGYEGLYSVSDSGVVTLEPERGAENG